MSLVFSGGTLVDTIFNLGTTAKKKALYDGVITALTSAGWTNTATLPIQILTVDNTANAANNETVVTLGKTYTFKTAINNGNDGEVLVGVDGATSFTNLMAAINLGAGSGTLYSTATTAGDGTITASSLGGTASDTLTYTANADDDAGGAVSETLGNGAWDVATLEPAHADMESAETPDFLTCIIKLIYDGESTNVLWMLYNRDKSAETEFLNTNNFTYTDSANQRIIASKYGFWCFKPGSASDFTSFACNVFSIPEPMRCKKITGATNAAPIAITTNVPHTYTTGDQVQQEYVEGNTAANAVFTITVTGPSTYTCDGSTGNGAFTGSKGVVGSIKSGFKEIFEFSFGYSAVKSGGGGQFRDTFDMVGETPCVFNGTVYNTNVRVLSTTRTIVQEDSQTYAWFNDAVIMDTPIFAVSEDAGTTWALAGQLYNAAILRQSIPMDQAIADESGNNWVSLTNSFAFGTYMVQVS